MRSRKIYMIMVLLLGVTLAGCNLPSYLTPTPFIFPSPTATQPAASNTPVAIPSTETSVPIVTATASETAIPSITPTSVPPSPTSTTAPTKTPHPTSTKTPLPGVSAAATFLSSAPKIDGPWDEWNTTQYPLKNVVFGKANWTGSSDLQASYRVGWDNKYLYLAVKVFDDNYVQNATGAGLYKGDSIELLFSTDRSADSSGQGLLATDYQIGISPGNPSVGKNMEAYLWYPKAKAGGLTKVKIGAISMTGGYRIEFAIPWSGFSVTPAKGQVFGFAVSVSDNDNSSKNVQETLISSAPNRILTDPTTWGILTLK